MRFGSTAKVLLKCKLKYYRISECEAKLAATLCLMRPVDLVTTAVNIQASNIGNLTWRWTTSPAWS